jgi:hypothetical protein
VYLSYKIGIEKGGLDLVIRKNRAVLWKKRFNSGVDSAEVRLPVKEKGRYNLEVVGNRAKGTFDITYKEADVKAIKVETNKNIELFGLMMQLNLGQDLTNNADSLVIENRKSTWKDWYRLAWNNYQHYREFTNSNMMRIYRKYSEEGFYDDFFIGFLVQVDEVPFAKINQYTDKEVIMAFSKTGDFAAAEKRAALFLRNLNSFYKEIGFADYLKRNDVYYEKILADVKKNLPPDGFIPEMEGFYRKAFNGYYLVPGLNIPTSMGFGKMNTKTQSIYNVFGPFSFQNFNDDNLQLGFDFPLRIEGLSVHEFGHSFVNPVIDQLPGELIVATQHLFTPIKEAMTKLAYPTWKICLYEHFVKAGEVILAEKLGRKKDAQEMLENGRNAGFIYLPEIVQRLKEYDKNVHISYYDSAVEVINKLSRQHYVR